MKIFTIIYCLFISAILIMFAMSLLNEGDVANTSVGMFIIFAITYIIVKTRLFTKNPLKG